MPAGSPGYQEPLVRLRTSRAIAVIADDGRVLAESRDLVPLYSVTKTYIAACLRAMAIDFGAPLSRWISRDWVPRADVIRVDQLLRHTSGLADYGSLPEYHDAVRAGRHPWTDDEFADRTLRRPLLFEPGSGWSYSNPGYWLLRKIAEREAGATFDEILRRFVAAPLGLRDTVVAHGQFAADLPAYPAEWVWHGLVVASPMDAVRFMSSQLVRVLVEDPIPVPVRHPQWSRPHHGWGVMLEPGECYGHNGDGPGYSASCFRFERLGVTGCAVVRGAGEGAAMPALLEAIAALDGNSYRATKPPADPNPRAGRRRERGPTRREPL